MSANTLVRPAWSPQADKIACVDTSNRPLAADVYEDGIWICNLTDGSITEVPLPPVEEKNTKTKGSSNHTLPMDNKAAKQGDTQKE